MSGRSEVEKGSGGEKRGSGAIRRSRSNTERTSERASESQVASQYLNLKTTRKQLVTPHRFFSSFAARKAGPEVPPHPHSSSSASLSVSFRPWGFSSSA